MNWKSSGVPVGLIGLVSSYSWTIDSPAFRSNNTAAFFVAVISVFCIVAGLTTNREKDNGN